MVYNCLQNPDFWVFKNILHACYHHLIVTVQEHLIFNFFSPPPLFPLNFRDLCDFRFKKIDYAER
jgi:hypothetical protein